MHTHTHESTTGKQEIWMRCRLMSISWYCTNLQDVTIVENLGKGHRDLSTISYNCMWIHSCLKLNSLIKKKKMRQNSEPGGQNSSWQCSGKSMLLNCVRIEKPFRFIILILHSEVMLPTEYEEVWEYKQSTPQLEMAQWGGFWWSFLYSYILLVRV